CSHALPSLHSFPTRRSSDLLPFLSGVPDQVINTKGLDWGTALVQPCPVECGLIPVRLGDAVNLNGLQPACGGGLDVHHPLIDCRSEEHTSELQSHLNLVCRL